MKASKITEEVELPDGVSASIKDSIVSITGLKGNLSRYMQAYNVNIQQLDNKIIFSSLKPSKREKRMIGTFSSHVRNMVKGVTKGYLYKLKVSSGHFPIAVAVKGSTLEIKNFFGERKPRTAKLLDNVDVKIEGDIIKVSGIDLELVSQTSANIEQATRITNRDKRVFMDRINIISKDED